MPAYEVWFGFADDFISQSCLFARALSLSSRRRRGLQMLGCRSCGEALEKDRRGSVWFLVVVGAAAWKDMSVSPHAVRREDEKRRTKNRMDRVEARVESKQASRVHPARRPAPSQPPSRASPITRIIVHPLDVPVWWGSVGAPKSKKAGLMIAPVTPCHPIPSHPIPSHNRRRCGPSPIPSHPAVRSRPVCANGVERQGGCGWWAISTCPATPALACMRGGRVEH